MGNRTLAIIKPDAVENQYTEAICERIVKAGFIILASKMIHMTKAETESFYAVHQGRPFYEELTTFMSSGQCMVLALEKEMLWMPGEKPLVPPTRLKPRKARSVKTLLRTWERTQFTDLTPIRMQKKRLPFSSYRVNLG